MYGAPEMEGTPSQALSRKTDIWSLGCVFLSLRDLACSRAAGCRGNLRCRAVGRRWHPRPEGRQVLRRSRRQTGNDGKALRLPCSKPTQRSGHLKRRWSSASEHSAMKMLCLPTSNRQDRPPARSPPRTHVGPNSTTEVSRRTAEQQVCDASSLRCQIQDWLFRFGQCVCLQVICKPTPSHLTRRLSPDQLGFVVCQSVLQKFS